MTPSDTLTNAQDNTSAYTDGIAFSNVENIDRYLKVMTV